MPQQPVSTCILLLTLALPAFTGEMNFLHRQLGRQKTSVNYGFEAYESKPIHNSHSSMDSVRHDINFLTPLFQNQEREWGLFGNAGDWNLDTAALLAQEPADRFPDPLYDAGLGSFYRWRLSNDWIAGIQLGISSPSDRPFAGWNETEVQALASLQIPAADKDAWYFFLAMNTRRGDLSYIPLPGAGYYWQPDETFKALLGLPFTMASWNPEEKWRFSATYLLPRDMEGEISYALLPQVSLYTKYTWDNRHYFRREREDRDDTLFYEEQRVTAGVRWQCSERLSFDLYGGYTFNRSFFEGEDYSDRHRHRLSISDGFVSGVQAGLQF